MKPEGQKRNPLATAIPSGHSKPLIDSPEFCNWKTNLPIHPLNNDVIVSGWLVEYSNTAAAAAFLENTTKQNLEQIASPRSKRVYRLAAAVPDPTLLSRIHASGTGIEILPLVAFYRPVMQGLLMALRRLMPSLHFVLSESGPLYTPPPAEEALSSPRAEICRAG